MPTAKASVDFVVACAFLIHILMVAAPAVLSAMSDEAAIDVAAAVTVSVAGDQSVLGVVASFVFLTYRSRILTAAACHRKAL